MTSHHTLFLAKHRKKTKKRKFMGNDEPVVKKPVLKKTPDSKALPNNRKRKATFEVQDDSLKPAKKLCTRKRTLSSSEDVGNPSKKSCTTDDSLKPAKKPCTRKRMLSYSEDVGNPSKKSCTINGTDNDNNIRLRHRRIWYPVDEQWQRDTCTILGLNFVAFNRMTPGGPHVVLDSTDRSKTKRIVGDDNCMFHALTYIITGSEAQHMELRQIILQYMPYVGDYLLRGFIQNTSSVEEYIRSNHLQNVGTWGTDVEMLLNTAIFSYEESVGRWRRYALGVIERAQAWPCTYILPLIIMKWYSMQVVW